MRATCSTVLLLLLAALTLVACGEASPAEYEQRLRGVGDIIERSLDALPADEGAQIGQEELDALANDVLQAADELAELDPPERVRGAQSQLEQGLRDVAAALQDLAEELGSADTPEEHADVFVEFATDEQIDDAFADIVTAQETFAEAGYRVFTPPAPRR